MRGDDLSQPLTKSMGYQSFAAGICYGIVAITVDMPQLKPVNMCRL
jgi:hypothetical protein